MKKIYAVMSKFYNLFAIVSCIMLVGVIVILIANILTRALFNAPIYGSFEYVSYLTMASVAFGLAYNENEDGNVKITLILEYMKPRMRNIFEIIAGILATLITISITYNLVLLIFEKKVGGDITENLHLPHWLLITILAVGFVLLTLCLILKLIAMFENHKNLPQKINE